MIPQRRKVCLYFGSFNPLHQMHLQLASYAVEKLPIDALWFVLSPLNPLKKNRGILPTEWRAHYIHQAIQGNDQLGLSLIEELLPEPHFSIRSIRALEMLYPRVEFSLLIGADNLQLLPKWYQYHQLLQRVEIFVYPRIGFPDVIPPELSTEESQRIHFWTDAPRSALAATSIREAALSGQDLRHESAVPHLWDSLVEELRKLYPESESLSPHLFT